MTALALLALSSPASALRFVYVDPKGFARLYGSPRVRSLRKEARQPDLSPDGRRFVYWTGEGTLAMIEHEIATGRERVLHRGNLRNPRYAADGKTIFFTEDPKDRWSLYALDRTIGRVRMVLRAWMNADGTHESKGDRVGDLFYPVPQPDGTVVVQDMTRALRVDAKGKILSAISLDDVAPQDGITSQSVLLPAPNRPGRMLGAFDVPDLKGRFPGTDGRAGAFWIYDAWSKKARRITPDTLDAMRPAWSRDGNTILFVGTRDKSPIAIWAIRPDGSGLRYVTGGEEPSAGLPSKL